MARKPARSAYVTPQQETPPWVFAHGGSLTLWVSVHSAAAGTLFSRMSDPLWLYPGGTGAERMAVSVMHV